uniref:Protein BCCIP homolog n=1 Tax=Angiostrongylus cantonensis TaxID=6313 RepID=A0A0K0D1V9_ANGCA
GIPYSGSNDASDSGDLIDDESSRRIDFDIEAFPMESGDREGVVNMLTQIFLRADIDLEGFANSIIAQSPLGLVFGPAEDQSEEESENVVYGVVTAVSLINLGNAPKFMKDILDFLEMKSRKFALKEFRDALEVAKSKRTGIFINERMLNFPYQIRRMTIRDLSNADVIFDNVEDKVLYQICEGEANFFDYPVHSEVESSSKFHILVKDGKSYKPYRRVVVMDIKRFDAFLEQVINGVF